MIRKEWKLKRKLTVTNAEGKFLAGGAVSVALSIAAGDGGLCESGRTRLY